MRLIDKKPLVDKQDFEPWKKPQYRIAYVSDRVVTNSIQIIKCRLVKLGKVL